MSKQMIAEGTKVKIVGEQGIFTVCRQIGEDENPLKFAFELVDEKGQGFWATVKDIIPTVGTTFGDFEWQDRYDISCPHCEHDMQCSESVFHRMGHITMGSGCCSKCDKAFALHFNPFANRMIARLGF